jgi:hypothetical protein
MSILIESPEDFERSLRQQLGKQGAAAREVLVVNCLFPIA